MPKQRSVLITGCLGGLGHTLSLKLLGKGWRVSGIELPGIDRRSVPEGLTLHRLNLGDTAAAKTLQKLATEHDEIIHLAGTSRVGQARKDPLGAIQANIVGTANLLDAIRAAPKHPWLLFASSLEVKVTSSGAFSLTNMYGLTKSVSELLAHRYASDYGLRIAAARIAGIYGDAADYPDKVPLVMVRAAVMGEPLRVARTGRKLAYVHIDAACAMLMEGARRLAKSDPGTFAVFKIESGLRLTLARLAQRIKSITRSNSVITSLETTSTADVPMTRWHIPHTGLSLDSGLARLAKALKNNR